MQGGEHRSYFAAPRVPAPDYLAVCSPAYGLEYQLGEILDLPARRPRAAAVTGHIERDDVPSAQRVDKRFEPVGIARSPVHQHDRRAVATALECGHPNSIAFQRDGCEIDSRVCQ